MLLSDHKEHAFCASFMEPARCYLTVSKIGPHWLQDNVDTHANNWYIALLNASLGVHVPLLANYWDDFPPPVCDFWRGLKDEAWEHFSNPAHFGNGWRGIPGLERQGRRLVAKKVETGHLPDTVKGRKDHPLGVGCNADLKPAKKWANAAVSPDPSQQKMREGLAIYLDRFAHFFSTEFFCKKAFEVLHSEFKPEHVGFRRACATLYAVYRREQPSCCPEPEFAEHMYHDDMYTELDLDNVARFFAWLGVVKPSCAPPLSPAAEAATAATEAVASEASEPGLAEEADTPPGEGQHEKELKELNAQIAQAMRTRDTAAIRELMAKRAGLQGGGA